MRGRSPTRCNAGGKPAQPGPDREEIRAISAWTKRSTIRVGSRRARSVTAGAAVRVRSRRAGGRRPAAAPPRTRDRAHAPERRRGGQRGGIRGKPLVCLRLIRAGRLRGGWGGAGIRRRVIVLRIHSVRSRVIGPQVRFGRHRRNRCGRGELRFSRRRLPRLRCAERVRYRLHALYPVIFVQNIGQIENIVLTFRRAVGHDRIVQPIGGSAVSRGGARPLVFGDDAPYCRKDLVHREILRRLGIRHRSHP